MPDRSPTWFRRKRVWLALLALVASPPLLFVFNGVFLAYGEMPVLNTTSFPPRASGEKAEPAKIKILAYNIAKCFAYEGGLRFASTEVVKERISSLAKIVRAKDPDFVFLSETVLECGPCPVNQVAELATATEMHQWAFGENYNIGFPGFRMVGGNAILSKWPIEGVANPSLAGRQPFYVTKNNRRVLWCKARIAGSEILLGSVHNDSFDVENNVKQVEQILDFVGERDAILAGDFNSLPEWKPIQRLRSSKRFAGNFEGSPSFPAEAPVRRIDFIFAPPSWKLVDERILCDPVSDHCAVVATFRR